MTKYRIEWATDPNEPFELDAWALATGRVAARRLAANALIQSGTHWLRVVRTMTTEGGIWVDQAEAFPGLVELDSWMGGRLPADASPRSAAVTPIWVRNRDRLLAAVAAVARWGLENGVLNSREADLISAKVALVVEPSEQPSAHVA